jgi:hypothetical protein
MRGRMRSYMRRPSAVSDTATRRRSPGMGLRCTQPFSSRLLRAREVRARSSCARSASSDDSKPSLAATVAITPHSRRVMPKCASHMRMATPPAAPK